MQTLSLNKTNYLTESLLKPLAISLTLALSAQINVLTYPVPITLQSFAILSIGLMCSPRVAVLSVTYYIIEIALGFPFASGFSSGLAALLSPRAGYFIGFLVSVYTSSKILTYKRNFFTLCLGATAGITLLYACGITWLSVLLGFEKAAMVGLYPFIAEIPSFIAIAVIGSYHTHKLSQKF
jgi:biotin transport system substrate-specific component